jgi:hypothetical protein
MFEAGLLVKAGTPPRLSPRLGVPLMVPVLEAILGETVLEFNGGELGADSMQDFVESMRLFVDGFPR